jgi:hypothetical protein
MDLTEALMTWDRIGNTTKSYDDEHNNYCIDFINKNNEKVGWVKIYPGQGIRWEYPDELFADKVINKQIDEQLTEADYFDGDASWCE